MYRERKGSLLPRAGGLQPRKPGERQRGVMVVSTSAELSAWVQLPPLNFSVPHFPHLLSSYWVVKIP